MPLVRESRNLYPNSTTGENFPAFMYHANDASYVVRFQSGLARLPKAFARTNTSSYD